MLGEAIRDRLNSRDFEPITLVLANGERIDVQHRDSVTMASVEVHGRRVFSSTVIVLETKGDEVIERFISLPTIAQVVKQHRLNGH